MGRRLPQADFAQMPWSGDPWHLVADLEALRLAQAPAVLAIGNGFIGVRGPGGAMDEPRVYLNGVYEEMPIRYHEAAHGYAALSDTRLPVADATQPTLSIGGAIVGRWDQATLDMASGRRLLRGHHDDVVIVLEQFVAMDRNLVATRVRITAGAQPISLAVSMPVPAPPGSHHPAEPDAPYDPRIGPGFAASPWREECARSHGRCDRLARSGHRVAIAVSGDRLMDLPANGEAIIDLYAAYEASAGAEDILTAAEATIAAAATRGFDDLAAAQRRWFDRFWHDAHVALPDAPAAEQALRHGLFQLVQAAGRDGRRSIAAKGQTGEGYEGHVFWDADTYVLPVFVHTAPSIARAMLAWRIAGLDAARANARAMGQPRGALYPWRTIGGRESSSFFPAGPAQYHINADIAHALRLYVEATGDASILAEGGAEMLAETARIWLQIGFHDAAADGAFVINAVTGPDEYSAIVDNNLYTNLMAAAHLRFAVEAAAQHLAPGEAAAMRRAADAMRLPFDAERGIPAQDERFFARQPWPFADTPADRYPLLLHYHPLTIYRHRVAKQADAVLAAALMPAAFAPEIRAAMLDAYEAVTVHDSTLSASPFATLAALAGDVERAGSYWSASVLTDLLNLFANSGHGLHMAALAGGWTALATGFAGMRHDDGLSFAPIAVPMLGRYAFRIRHRDRSLLIEVGADTARYTLEAGGALTFCHRDESITLSPGTSAERPLA